MSSSSFTPGSRLNLSTEADVQTRAQTPIGVDVGVNVLIAALPADAALDEAFIIEGDHLRKRYRILTAAMTALQNSGFDSTEGEIQLFTAMWRQIRAQVFDAAVRAVRYAQQHSDPVLVIEDLSDDEYPLWNRRTGSEHWGWLLSALQTALVCKANEAGVPITAVDPAFTTQECHHCDEIGECVRRMLKCTNDDCPVDYVCRDRSAAASIAKRSRQHDT